jgi:hypothetical protein
MKNWLKILRPLTYESSLKYGSSTTWCTASKDSRIQYDKYTKGILIYSINKKMGFKVATHLDFSNQELTFWNAEDKRIDSMASRLPSQILEIVRNELDINGKSNYDLSKKIGLFEKSGAPDSWRDTINDLLRGNNTPASDEYDGDLDDDPDEEGVRDYVMPPSSGKTISYGFDPASNNSAYNSSINRAKKSFMDKLKDDLNRRDPAPDTNTPIELL